MSNQKEPIAIIGIGCRFPGGGANPRLFWRNLCQGKDAITNIPDDRWDIRKFYDPDPDKPGKTYARQGGFLKEKINLFDPLFFGISPREAESMDPQQRLLLEVTWEAIEDAGMQLANLQGSKTGVFIGGFMLDNMLMSMGQLNRELVDTHTPISSTMTILSNRLSYVFDLHGPSVSMDTACSSSLVAAHYACQSIWNGESDMAITGGVNVMLRPEYPIAMSKGQFLSAHARCKAFDEEAAGYTRGEGAGVVLLKPLRMALEDRDHIYALVKLSGVNQDGRTPGISMPNPEAQEKLIRQVYEQAGVSPAHIQYVEAHGTGTRAGDPKEARALHNVLNTDRVQSDKCLVGSVKTNIGHLEAGAGVAGLIKASLCLHEGKIPPSLHFKHPNPDIPFDHMCIRVPTKLEDWPDGNHPRFAGVNSFGYGGTNAHILLQQAPDKPADTARPEISWQKPYLVPISARSDKALQELAGKYAFYLSAANTDGDMADFLYTASQRRTHHHYRAAIVADSTDELRNKMELVSTGVPVDKTYAGLTEGVKPKLVFVYSGMGPQWWAMARELLEQEEIFRTAVEDCDRLFQNESGWSILSALLEDEQSSMMAKTEVAQPANFVVQYALTRLLEHYGITPDAVIGHSVGEVTSTCVSGALTLAEAIKVSFQRSRLQATTAGQGGMLAAAISEQDGARILQNYPAVSIGAVNGPASITLSGDEEQLQSIAESLQKENIFNRALTVEVAYHSQQMDMIKEELLQELAQLAPSSTAIDLYSTVTGGLIDGNAIDNDYWWNNVRQPVKFYQGITSLIESGHKTFLEIGPHPVLSHSIREIASGMHEQIQITPTLNRKTPDYDSMFGALGQLYCQGFDISWPKLVPAGGSLVSLPTYPWQRDNYWRESQASRQDRLGNPGHVLFNRQLDAPLQGWCVEINNQYFPFLDDHRVNTEIVFPGAAYVEAGLALHRKLHGKDTAVIADLVFHNMLIVEPKRNQILCTEYLEDQRNFNIYSRYNEDEADWKKHASGKIIKTAYHLLGKREPADFELLRRRMTEECPADTLYLDLQGRGLDYGHQFRNARQLWHSDREFLVHIDSEDKFSDDKTEYTLHPAILDCAIHSLLAIIPDNNAYVPVTIERVILQHSPPPCCWCHGVLIEHSNDTLIADFTIYDEQGQVCVEIKSCISKALLTAYQNKADTPEEHIYLPVWQEYQAQPAPVTPARLLLFSTGTEASAALEKQIGQGHEFINVTAGEKFRCADQSHYEINPDHKQNFDRLLGETGQFNPEHIFYLWPLGGPIMQPAAAEIGRQCMTLIHLVQACHAIQHDIHLTVFTRGAQSVTGREPSIDLNCSPFWGLLPLIENEFPNIHYRIVDLDPDEIIAGPVGWSDLLFDGAITDLGIRSGSPYIKKLTRLPQAREEQKTATNIIPAAEPFVLFQQKPGYVESLSYRACDRPAPAEGQVEIKVHYTGVNFKDVLKSYGSISEQAIAGTYFGTMPGMEISGTVTAVGSNVTNIHPGDEVVAAAQEAYRSYVVTPAQFVVKKPPNLSFQDSLYHIVFCTAYHALVDIARLANGEKILIHSAAGGLGLAAIQVASLSGAEIYATASTDEKRDYLLSLGITRVMDSRSLDFYDEILETTDGYGVDVILNTLSGEALMQSMNLLAPYGRFIEAGKTDIVANAGLPMLPFNRNITFSAVDFDRMHAEKPELVARLMDKVSEGFAQGRFNPLPLKIFKADDVVEAFRFMAQGKHIGKIAIKYDNESVSSEGCPEKPLFSHKGSYLIAGGTSGFGLEVARWLAEKDVGRLILISRSGAKSQECQRVAQKLKQQGKVIEVHAVDVSDADAIQKLITDLQNDGPPLLGIFNSAMVLDDAFLKDMTMDRFMKVLSPKVTGTLNLYNCSRTLNLDFFVSFSSISSLVGNRGQANYVAANAFLDEFAFMARADNFPAYTINWGVLAEAGVVERNREIGDLLELEGIKGLTNKAAFAAIERVLLNDNAQTGIFDINWGRWGKLNQTGHSNRFRELVEAESESSHSLNQKTRAVLEEIKDMSDSDTADYVCEILRTGLARIIRLTPDRINNTQKLDTLGIDSLILLELSVAINEEFGIEISAMELFKQPTILSLANEIIRRLMLMTNNKVADTA